MGTENSLVTQTVSAAQPALRSQSLGMMDRVTNTTPASKTEFRNQLTACLVLTAPTGMTEEARSDWLRVAWMTVSHLPSDLLERGCKKARETADHPSKIVPIILKEVESDMEWRRRMAAPQSSASLVTALPEPKREYCTAEEAAKILQEVGLRAKWKGQSDE